MKKILFIASAILILLSGCENFLDSELLTENMGHRTKRVF